MPIVTQNALSMPVLIGILMLMGIVTKNAILLVDRTLRNVRDHDDRPREAVAEAVGSRVRPIFMSGWMASGRISVLVGMPVTGWFVPTTRE